MFEQETPFVMGILATLQGISTNCVGISGMESIYHNIVKENDIDLLCQVARSRGLLKSSGLVTHGYALSDEDACNFECIKPLSPEERRDRERQILSCAQKGDPLAKRLLLRDYEVVINTILLRKFAWMLGDGHHLQREDLRQEARYAFFKALRKYDSKREDASFRSLIDIVIVSHIHNVIRQHEAIVSYPTKAYSDGNANLFNSTSSLDDDGSDRVEAIEDETAHENILKFSEKSEFEERVRALLWFLPDREHFMLRVFFGFDGRPLTKAAIAKDFGQSPALVNLILESALGTLREWIVTGQTPKKQRKPDLKRLSRWH